MLTIVNVAAPVAGSVPAVAVTLTLGVIDGGVVELLVVILFGALLIAVANWAYVSFSVVLIVVGVPLIVSAMLLAPRVDPGGSSGAVHDVYDPDTE